MKSFPFMFERRKLEAFLHAINSGGPIPNLGPKDEAWHPDDLLALAGVCLFGTITLAPQVFAGWDHEKAEWRVVPLELPHPLPEDDYRTMMTAFRDMAEHVLNVNFMAAQRIAKGQYEQHYSDDFVLGVIRRGDDGEISVEYRSPDGPPPSPTDN